MKKIAFLIAASVCLLAAPAAVQPASAQSVTVGVGDNGYHYGWRNRAYRSRAEVVIGHPRCRTVIIRHKRWDGTIVIRRERHCRD